MEKIIKQLEYLKQHQDLIEDLNEYIDNIINDVQVSITKLQLQNTRMKTILEVLVDKMARG